MDTGLLYRVPMKDIPPDVLHSTHPYYRNSFCALPELNEGIVREVLGRLRGKGPTPLYGGCIDVKDSLPGQVAGRNGIGQE